MKILEKLKADRLESRKNANPNVKYFSFLISEIEKIGKNAGNRETTEDEAIQRIKKLLSDAKENMKTKGLTMLSSDVIVWECSYLESLLPTMADENTIREFLKTVEGNNKGIFMKELKNKFGQSVDMKMAASLVDERMISG